MAAPFPDAPRPGDRPPATDPPDQAHRQRSWVPRPPLGEQALNTDLSARGPLPEGRVVRGPRAWSITETKPQAGACSWNGSGAICPASRVNDTKATPVLLPPENHFPSLICSLRSPQPPSLARIRAQLQPRPKISAGCKLLHGPRAQRPGTTLALSRQRSQERCRPPRPARPSWGSSRLSPTAPGGRLGAPGSQARSLPESPVLPCPAGCSWQGSEKWHWCLCPPGTLEADGTCQQSRRVQGPGGAGQGGCVKESPPLPICPARSRGPLLNQDRGTEALDAQSCRQDASHVQVSPQGDALGRTL